MQKVNFKPWVGKNYQQGIDNKKILVLGESHHCASEVDCHSQLTIDVINNFIITKSGDRKSEPWMNTFTKFTNIVFGRKVEVETLVDFWNRVVFYNYVQTAMSGPRQSPTEQDFKNSESAFFQILDEYQPDLVIIWGKRLWNACSQIGGTAIENGGYYESKDKKILAYYIPHPASSKLNGKEWHEYIQAAIKQVGINF